MEMNLKRLRRRLWPLVLSLSLLLLVVLAVPLFLLMLFVLAAQLVPDTWLRARPRGDPRGVEVAIILGFGYKQGPQGMMAGAANAFLLRWVLNTYPQVKTILVQEGVWAAACPETAASCRMGDVELLRIHRHDPAVDVKTWQVTVCAVERMQALGATRALLVAHDLQLARAAADFERVRRALGLDWEFVIPPVPDTPFPAHSAQWRTRNAFVYRAVDLLARVRDVWRLGGEVEEGCVAPL